MTDLPGPQAAAPASHPVLLMNPRSGGGKASRFALADRCRQLGVEPVELREGDDLVQLAEDALERGCDLLGMAGGDGSQALVASVAARHHVPLLVVPAGTRNHFALDLGVGTDVVESLRAFVDGVDVAIDLGDVNGRVFVNNVSMGVYAAVVRSPRYRDAKLRTALELLPELVGPSAEQLDLRYRLPSGELATTAQVLLVSNNRYDLSAVTQHAGRPRLDSGELGVVSVRIAAVGEARVLASLDPAAERERLPGWHEWTTPSFEVTSGEPIAVGLDGEALTLDPPLRFTTRPGELVVRVPRVRGVRRPRLRPSGAAPSPFAALSRLISGQED